jgi:hypothetical protein
MSISISPVWRSSICERTFRLSLRSGSVTRLAFLWMKFGWLTLMNRLVGQRSGPSFFGRSRLSQSNYGAPGLTVPGSSETVGSLGSWDKYFGILPSSKS